MKRLITVLSFSLATAFTTTVCVTLLTCSYAFATVAELDAGKIEYEHVMTIGEQGSGPGQFRYVEDFALSHQGHLLVTDAKNPWIQVFDKNTGQYIHAFAGEKDKFEKPEGIAVDDDGNIFVADYASGYIQKFNKDYQHLSTFSDFGTEPGETMETEFMTIYNRKLYVADTGNNRIDVFGLDGEFLFLFGLSEGLSSPQAAKSSLQGDIYVVDLGNDRLLKYDDKGTLIGQYGVRGKALGEFDKPVGLAIDDKGNIYVSEAHNSRIQVFDENFKLLAHWGKHGSAAGEFKNLHGLLVDERGYVYAADTGNNRIQVFAPVNH